MSATVSGRIVATAWSLHVAEN